MIAPPSAAAAIWAPALCGVVLGAVIGSFVATLVLRWPAGRDLGGRSACDGCGAQLRPSELVPLLSYALQGGRCRRCTERIDPTHVVIEGLCALAGGAAFGLVPGAAGWAGALFGWLLVALAALDFKHFWLPDRLTGALAVLGLASGLAGLDPALGDRLIGGAAGFATLWLIGASYRKWRQREGLGAGDPKLFGAIGLWIGWQALPLVLLGASGVGLSVALGMALRGKVSGETRLPLGTLLAVAAFPAWIWINGSYFA